MTELIYILGSGRSGSTVIERVLNSAPSVVAVGEMHALWRLPITDLVCSCGCAVSACGFWRTVLSHADIGPAEIARLAQLEREVVRNSYLVRMGFDLERIRQDPRLAEFATFQTRLLNGIRVAGQGSTVLDSSKAGPRAWVLAAMLDPVVLHVYRGAEDVIASWRRPKFDPSTQTPMKKPSLFEAGFDWVKAEQTARSLARARPVARIDYQAFSTMPQVALKDTLEPVAPGIADAVNWVGAAKVRPSATYHSVLGNPDRFGQGDIEIAPQRAADRARFSNIESGVIGALGRTLERAYP